MPFAFSQAEAVYLFSLENHFLLRVMCWPWLPYFPSYRIDIQLCLRHHNNACLMLIGGGSACACTGVERFCSCVHDEYWRTCMGMYRTHNQSQVFIRLSFCAFVLPLWGPFRFILYQIAWGREVNKIGAVCIGYSSPSEGQALVRAHTGDWNTSGHLYSEGNLWTLRFSALISYVSSEAPAVPALADPDQTCMTASAQ